MSAFGIIFLETLLGWPREGQVSPLQRRPFGGDGAFSENCRPLLAKGQRRWRRRPRGPDLNLDHDTGATKLVGAPKFEMAPAQLPEIYQMRGAKLRRISTATTRPARDKLGPNRATSLEVEPSFTSMAAGALPVGLDGVVGFGGGEIVIELLRAEPTRLAIPN